MPSNDTEILLDTPFNGKQYGSLLTSPATPLHGGQHADQHSIVICGIGLSQVKYAILIALVAVIVNVLYYVSMPIYLLDLVQSGSDPFVLTVMSNLSCLVTFTVMVVRQWCRTRERPVLHPCTRYRSAALFGLFASMHDILVAFGSLPTRTSPQLLGILSAAVLPNTLICRFIILRKGVSVKRLLCAGIVLFGAFISLIPNILSLGSDSDVNSSHPIPTYFQAQNGTNHTASELDSTVEYGWIWPLVVLGSTVPLAIALVILEQEIKAPNVSLITFVFWGELFKCLSRTVLFWSTLIPNFGMTNNIGELLTSLGRGLYCSFSSEPSCSGCLGSGISFAFITAGVFVFIGLLTKYAEGAVYTTIIKSLSKAISTLFWTLFVDTPLLGLLWRPQFNINTLMAFVSLLFIIPATCVYTYLSHREQVFSNTKSK